MGIRVIFLAILFIVGVNRVDAAVTFEGTGGVKNVLGTNCVNCHSYNHSGYLNYETVRSEIGSSVVVNSMLERIHRPQGSDGAMPIQYKLTDNEIGFLESWAANKLEHAPPQVNTLTAVNTRSYSTTLRANVQENGIATSFKIKYWQQGNPEPASCPVDNTEVSGCTSQASASGTGGNNVFAAISLEAKDLNCNTSYLYRALSLHNGTYDEVKAQNTQSVTTGICLPLTINSIPVEIAEQYSFYSYDVNVAFTEKTVEFSLDLAPAGMSINSQTGFIQWLPDDSLLTADVIVRAREINGTGNTTQAFTITVNEPDTTTNSGRAYSIPVLLEPGINNVKPRLEFEFDKNIVNDLLGVGWRLKGLSEIERCVGTRDIDGVAVSIKNFNTDRFCLDGQRLIVSSGDYNDEGGVEYQLVGQTDIIRIESFGVDNDGPYAPASAGRGPAFFRAWKADGTILEFGKYYEPSNDAYGGIYSAKVPASRFEANNNLDIVTRWSLSRVITASGDEYRVSYYEDNFNGEQRPIRVDYTANSVNGVAPRYAVEFEYEGRHDKLTYYKGGSQNRISTRLGKIKMLDDDSLLYEYRLSYETAPDNERSRLRSIDKCVTNLPCENYALINWQNGNMNLDYRLNYEPEFADRQNQFSTTSLFWEPVNTVAVDYDGDGKDEVLRRVKGQTHLVWERYENVNGRWTVEVVDYVDNFFSGSSIFDEVFVFDLDGDGVYQMLLVRNRTRNHRVYNLQQDGSIDLAFFTAFRIVGTDDVTHGISFDSSTAFIKDFTGDGIDDMLVCNIDSEYRYNRSNYLLSKHGLPEVQAVDFGKGLCSSETRIGDVNGDGLPDLITRDDNGFFVNWYLSLNTGEIGSNLFSPKEPISRDSSDNAFINESLSFAKGIDKCRTCTTDINYDGLDDLIFNQDDDDPKVFYSFGHFRQNDPDTESTYRTNIFSQSNSFPLFNDPFGFPSFRDATLFDLNNDGMPELLTPYGDWHHLNGHNTKHVSNNLFNYIESVTGVSLFGENGHQFGKDTVILDSNGDGAQELLLQWVHVLGHIPGLTDNLPEKDSIASTSGTGFNLANPDLDLDLDGLPNGQELDIGTDPTHEDTDRDGTADGDEVAQGSDPLVNGVPAIVIVSPVNAETYNQGQTISFNGLARDPEEGDISDSISWSSNIDGSLGVGGSLPISNLSVGNHTIRATITDSAGAVTINTVNITVVPNTSPASSVTLSTDVSSPQRDGQVVVLTAQADGGSGNYIYQFRVNGPNTNNQWQILQDFSNANTYSWDSSGYISINSLQVRVRNAGTVDTPVDSTLNFQVNRISPSSSTSLVANVSSPQPVGAVVPLSAEGQGGGTGSFEYEFSYRGPSTNNSWQVLQAFSKDSSANWLTDGLLAGDYSVRMRLRGTVIPGQRQRRIRILSRTIELTLQ